MKKQNTDSVQNRFTAYLIAAVVHQRMRYMEKKKLLLQREDILAEQEIKKYLNLENNSRDSLKNKVVLPWKIGRSSMNLYISWRATNWCGH